MTNTPLQGEQPTPHGYELFDHLTMFMPIGAIVLLTYWVTREIALLAPEEVWLKGVALAATVASLFASVWSMGHKPFRNALMRWRYVALMGIALWLSTFLQIPR